MTIAEAFAQDDVVDEFVAEKKTMEERDKPKDIDLTLPGELFIVILLDSRPIYYHLDISVRYRIKHTPTSHLGENQFTLQYSGENLFPLAGLDFVMLGRN